MSQHWISHLRKLAALICFSLLLPQVRSDSVVLSWLASPSVAAVGYYVYYGTAGNVTNKLDAGNQLSTTVSGLLPGNTYSLYATSYDSVGDESGPSATLTYYVNGVPGTPVASNLSVQTYVNQGVPVTLVGSDSNGNPLTYRIVSSPAHGALSGTSPSLVYTPAANYLGSDSFTYVANDGTLDSNPATVSISVLTPPDTTPPTASILAPLAGSTLTGVASINVAATDNVGVTRVELYLNGGLAGSATTAPVTFTWSTTTSANGTWIIQAKAYDQAGNVGTSTLVSVTVQNPVPDTTPPTVSILAPLAGSDLAGSASISVTATDNVGVTRVELYLNGGLAGSTTNASAVFTWNTTTATNGAWAILAKAYDQAGNVGSSAPVSVTVTNIVPDTTPPSVRVTSPASSSTVSGIVQVQAVATDNVGVTQTKCLINGALLWTSTNASPTFSWDTTKSTNGTYTVQVQAFDAAGNSTTASATGIKVANAVPDTTPPQVTITAPTSGATIVKNFNVKVSSSDNVGVVLVQLYYDGKLAASSTSSSPSFSMLASKITKGTHTLVAKAYDAANNVGTSSTVTISK
jgi:hypothetical protein